MDPFVEQLKECCQQFPTRSKWVFVPTHAIGLTLGERLVLEGTNWLNLRFVTPLDIALRMGAPFLVERGIDPSEEALGPALMMRLLMDLPAQGGYFRPLAVHPTLAQAMWATLRELRMAGKSARDLKADAFANPVKHQELVSLLGRYEAFLDSQKRADMATVYSEALEHLDWSPVQPGDLRTELPDANWNPLQRRLIDALPGDPVQPRAFALAGVQRPRRLATRPAARIEPDRVDAPLAYLLAPAGAAVKDIALFHAGGREAEIDEVFRRILAAGAALDQVEIACASEAHLALVWEKAQRHDWPVTLGAGIPATFTRPGRALLGLCDWVETDFSAGHFRRLLQSGDVSVEKEHGFTAGQAARVLAKAEAGWGRGTYQRALSRLAKDYEARATDADTPDVDRDYLHERAQQAVQVRQWMVSLLDTIPSADDNGPVPLQSVVDAVLAFLEHRVARTSALDHRAADALAGYVSDLRALGEFSSPLHEALRFIRERVESLSVAPERSRPGHLFASALAQSGYAGRAHLFVVGLEEGGVFASATEDPVLLDEERAVLSPDLRLSNDRIDEAVHATLSRLAVSAATHVTFSFSCRDTREFRETFASWLMLQAYRLQQGNASLTYQDMRKALGEPVSAVPATREHSLSPSAWWLRSVAGAADDGVASVEAAYPWMASGRAAEARRSGPDLTPYDGYVPEAGPVLDPAHPDIVYSVTELEKAAECPFRFFLKRGLGIRPVDERERDRDVWLDPLTRGSALHDIYAAYLRKVRDERRRPAKTDEPWLLDYAQRHLDQLHAEMPAPTDEVLKRETSAFLADVSLFLDAEIEDHTRTAVGLEVSFGRPLGDDGEEMASEEPAAITLGEGVTLRFAGRIDRVNEVETATFEVLDYKTGGYYRDEWKGTFNGGRRLQHALYGLAVVGLLKEKHGTARVHGGSYYFSSTKGGGNRVDIPAPSTGAIAAVLADLRAVITAGAFLRTPDNKRCTFCDFDALCGEQTNTQAEAKRGDLNAAAFVRLGNHA